MVTIFKLRSVAREGPFGVLFFIPPVSLCGESLMDMSSDSSTVCEVTKPCRMWTERSLSTACQSSCARQLHAVWQCIVMSTGLSSLRYDITVTFQHPLICQNSSVGCSGSGGGAAPWHKNNLPARSIAFESSRRRARLQGSAESIAYIPLGCMAGA